MSLLIIWPSCLPAFLNISQGIEWGGQILSCVARSLPAWSSVCVQGNVLLGSILPFVFKYACLLRACIPGGIAFAGLAWAPRRLSLLYTSFLTLNIGNISCAGGDWRGASTFFHGCVLWGEMQRTHFALFAKPHWGPGTWGKERGAEWGGMVRRHHAQQHLRCALGSTNPVLQHEAGWPEGNPVFGSYKVAQSLARQSDPWFFIWFWLFWVKTFRVVVLESCVWLWPAPPLLLVAFFGKVLEEDACCWGSWFLCLWCVFFFTVFSHFFREDFYSVLCHKVAQHHGWQDKSDFCFFVGFAVFYFFQMGSLWELFKYILVYTNPRLFLSHPLRRPGWKEHCQTHQDSESKK